MNFLKIRTCLILFISCLVLFWAIKIPAGWLIKQIEPLSVALEAHDANITGTLWKGKSQWRELGQPVSVRWSLSPLCFFVARLCVDIEAKVGETGGRGVSHLNGGIKLSLWGMAFNPCMPKLKLGLSSLEGKIFAQSLGPFIKYFAGVEVKWEDAIYLQDLNLAMDIGQWLTSEASGLITWPGGKFQFLDRGRFQNYKLSKVDITLDVLDEGLFIEAKTVVQAGYPPTPILNLVVKPDGVADLNIFKALGILTNQLPKSANMNETIYEEVIKVNDLLCEG